MVRLMIRILLVLFVSITVGCNLPTTQANPEENSSNPNQGSSPEFGGPQIIINDPPSGHFANPNTSILVHSIASDELGISRVDLLVNGILARSDGTPDGVPQRQYSLLQAWNPKQIGDYVLAVIAYCSDGTPSEQAEIIVHVVEAEGIPETGAENSQDCIATALTTLNIRQGPGVVYTIDGSLLLGQKAHVTGKNINGHWWQIDFNGAAGWISAIHTITEGGCDDIGEVAAPPPPAGATPLYRTPAPVVQAGASRPNEAETTVWTIWEVIVDVWVQFFGPGPGDDSGDPPPETTPSEGYPPPRTTTPTRRASTTPPEGYPPPSTNTPDGYPPPVTDTPAGYPPLENTASQGYPYPPPVTTQIPPAPTAPISTETPALTPTVGTDTPVPTLTFTVTPTPAFTFTPRLTRTPPPPTATNTSTTSLPTATDEPTGTPTPPSTIEPGLSPTDPPPTDPPATNPPPTDPPPTDPPQTDTPDDDNDGSE